MIQIIALAMMGWSSAYAGGCDPTWLSEAVVDAPAVIVLGARRGMQPDLFRARRLIKALSEKAEVTLALDILPVSAADDYRLHLANGFGDEVLPLALDWDDKVGLPWSGYKGFFTDPDLRWVPVGVGPGEHPDSSEPVQIPMGLGNVLRDTSAGNFPAQRQEVLLRAIAWQDSVISQRAIDGWDGDGYLVVLVDRFRVYGRSGVDWHLPYYTKAPVSSYLLSWSGEDCTEGEKVFTFLPFVPLP